HLLAQVSDGSKNGKWKGYLNYEGSMGMGNSGDGSVKSQNQIDFVGTGVITSKFNIGVNLTAKINSYNSFGGTTAKSDAWGGAALYLNYDPTAIFGLTLRSEYFIDNDDLTGLGTQNILDETLSANIRVGAVTIIPELRYESADTKFGDIYTKGKDATPTGTDFSGILAAVYKF
ncbi:MAG TPA: outer membrane beta-barrel protein, partial [Ferruginibacter sp.]|nr:outer membrane beta-barrel protein [Ferruginibacter sp.]HTB52559.1 outer membrane beta-barrel protein [Ferruginibacter sp.]